MVSFNRRIVRILEETGLVEMDVLAKASSVANAGEQSVTEYLLEQEIFTEGDLLGVLADRLAVPPIDLDRVTIPDELPEVLPADLARETGCLPICKTGGLLTVAVSNPLRRRQARRHPPGDRLRPAPRAGPRAEDRREDRGALQRGRDQPRRHPRRGRSRGGPGAHGRGRRGRRHRRAQRRQGRRARHQARQPPDLQRDQGEGVRHPRRALREARARPLPPGRRPRGRHGAAEASPELHHEPPQDHGGPRHRGEAQAPGRQVPGQGRRTPDRLPCLDAAHGLRREGRAAYPRRLEPRAPRSTSSASRTRRSPTSATPSARPTA